MAPRYDEAPELTPEQGLPELHHPPAAPEVNLYYNQQPYQPIKQDIIANYQLGSYGPPTATTSTFGNGQSSTYGVAPSDPGRRSKGRIVCGCSLLVFILSSIIAILSVAVIGLAAGTGVEASRANDAESNLAALKAGGAAATTTVTAPASASTSDFNLLDRNCTSDPDGVTGTTYSSTFFNHASYQIHCNRDTKLAPIQSLFVGNFDDCIDACSSYSYYITDSNSTTANQTCSGVSFIPAWTNRTTARRGTAPGNCYLKPGPQNDTSLYTPVSGSETHAAIVVDSS